MAAFFLPPCRVRCESLRTRDVEDGLESHAEVSDLVWIVLLDGLKQHADTFPVILAEDGVIVGVQRGTLHSTSFRRTAGVFK